jgi:hypothetical protein
VKIWLADGTIVYSDEHRLIGSKYSLGTDEQAALRDGTTEAEISDLKRPENRFERRFGKLLEVYLPIRDTAGRELVYEDYERYSSVAASGRRLWLSFAPAILGALALLCLIQIPLAWRATRRLQHGQANANGCCGARSTPRKRSGGGSPATCTTAPCRISPASRTA